MRFVDNGVPEDYARLCFEGMTVPLCELSEEEYMQVVFGIEGYQPKMKRTGGYKIPIEEKDPIMYFSIDDLDLSQRPNNCLRRAGITTIGQLCELTETQLKKIRNMGIKSVKEVIDALARVGYKLKEEVE